MKFYIYDMDNSEVVNWPQSYYSTREAAETALMAIIGADTKADLVKYLSSAEQPLKIRGANQATIDILTI